MIGILGIYSSSNDVLSLMSMPKLHFPLVLSKLDIGGFLKNLSQVGLKVGLLYLLDISLCMFATKKGKIKQRKIRYEEIKIYLKLNSKSKS